MHIFTIRTNFKQLPKLSKMVELPIEPNLKNLQEIFIFDFSSYKKILEKDFDEKNYTCLHFLSDIFEQYDAIFFYSKSIGTKLEPRHVRYIKYRSGSYYFIAKLNDVKSIYNFIGVTPYYHKLSPLNNENTKTRLIWKKELVKYKQQKKFTASELRANKLMELL